MLMGYLQWQRTADLAAHASRYISRCLPPHRPALGPALGPAFARSLGHRGRLGLRNNCLQF